MSRIKGLRVLVVEDEPIVAMSLEDILEDLGCTAIGPAAHLAEGLALARDSAPDAAILDINLGGESSVAIAEWLQERAIPFAFASGYGAPPEGFEKLPLIEKPYQQTTIAAVLERLMSSGIEPRAGR